MTITKKLVGFLCVTALSTAMAVAAAAADNVTTKTSSTAPVVAAAPAPAVVAPAPVAPAPAVTAPEAASKTVNIITPAAAATPDTAKKAAPVAKAKAKTAPKAKAKKPAAKKTAKAKAPATEQKADAPKAEKHASYAEKGANACLKCHNEAPVTDILHTQHAAKGDSRTPFAAQACETCHGASPEHMTSKGKDRVSPTIVFKGPKKSPVAERNKVCLSCHDNGLRTNWPGSKHESNDVDCASCHTLHATKDKTLSKQTQSETCYTCHAEQRAQSFQFSHHPIREGKVACSDCHNPHGTTGSKMLKENTVNETCQNCHADKRGPFLWEHEPVREDCMVCHTPHGSTQPRLLKERPPFLCQECHSNSGHNAGPFAASNLPTPGGNARAVSARMLARGCVNCHSNIHGSNSPSGAFFTR